MNADQVGAGSSPDPELDVGVSVVRLSPFVGVSHTALRFVLLSLTTLAAASYAWQYIHAGFARRGLTAADLCIQTSTDEPSPPFSSAYARCWAEQQAHPLAATIALGQVVTITVALAVFVLAPALTRRRRQLSPWDDALDPALQAEVAAVALRMRVATPVLLIDPRPAGTARMLSAGFSRSHLVLSAGLAVLRTRRPDQFRAVVAHELAHVRNADVRLAELAVAMWWALVLAVCAPYLASALASGSPVSVVTDLVALAVVTLLARALRNALLRSREIEADLRASTVAELAGPLLELLSRAGDGMRVRALPGAHPRATDRVTAIRHPDTILRIAPLDLVSLGAIGYFLMPGLRYWLQQLTFGLPVSLTLASAAQWLVAAAIGTGVWALGWSQAVAERFSATPRYRSFGGALWLGLGLATGAALVPLPREVGGVLDRHTLPQWVAFAAVVYLGSWVCLAAALAIARSCVRHAVSRRGSRRLNAMGAIMVLGTAGVAFGLVNTFVLFAQPGIGTGRALLLATYYTVALSPGTWLAAAALVAGAVVLRSSRPLPPGTVPPWLALDAGAAPGP